MYTWTEVVKEEGMWVAKIHWGPDVEVCGPYRFKWFAKLVAWIFDGMH